MKQALKMLFVDDDFLLERTHLSCNHNAYEYAVENASNQANPKSPLGPFAGFLRRLLSFLIAACVVERAHICSLYDAHDAQWQAAEYCHEN